MFESCTELPGLAITVKMIMMIDYDYVTLNETHIQR